MNILALGAHPDDIECFCSGTLLRYRAAGHRIFLALTTSGNAGSNVIPTTAEVAATREAEQLVAARAYDAEVRFLGFDDQGLHDTPETRRAVRSAIRWANPDVILTNPPWDMSTDHAVTGKLVADLMLSLGGKLHPSDVPPITKAPSLFFWDIAAGLRFDPEAYVDISEHAEQKASLINTHVSQRAWMGEFFEDDFAEASMVLSRLRGLQSGTRYAEGFVGYKIQGFVADYRLLP